MSFYAATKKATEAMAHSYAHLYDLPVTMFRFFTVYGPWGRPDMALFKFTKRDARRVRRLTSTTTGKCSAISPISTIWSKAIIDLAKAVPDTRVGPLPHDSLSPVAPWRVVNIGNSEPVQAAGIHRGHRSLIGDDEATEEHDAHAARRRARHLGRYSAAGPVDRHAAQYRRCADGVERVSCRGIATTTTYF